MDRKIDSDVIRAERRRRLIKYISIIAIIVAVMWTGISMVGTSVNRRDLTIASVDNGPLEITVPASGRVVPAYEEIVNSPVTTRIMKVYAQPGDTVKAGTPLLQLDLEQEETALDKLIDSRTIGQQELEQLRLSHRTLLSDLEMQIEVSEMQASRLSIEVINERRLDSIGSGTGDRVRQAETAYATAVLQLRQLRTKLENERMRTVAAEQVQQLGMSNIDKDIMLKQRTLEQGRIPAPSDGIITFLITEIGSQVNAGERVAVVSDLSQFRISAEVPEGSSNKVEIGAEVNVRIGQTIIRGCVTNITPQAKAGVVSFMVRLDDPRNSRLRSGLRTDLYVTYGYKDNVTRIPSGPFFKGPGDYSLFVMDGDSRLVKRQVKLGDSNREYIEVTDGLMPGDRVAVNDMERYRTKRKLGIR